jgi:hypothetical protein
MRVVGAVIMVLTGLAGAEPGLCRKSDPVDLVDLVFECHDAEKANRSFPPEVSARAQGGGWSWARSSDGKHFEFTPDENAAFDRLLVDGVRRLCAGEGDKSARYESLHRKGFGYPLDACRPSERYIVVHKGKTTLAVRVPMVAEMIAVQKIVHMHELGYHAVFAQPAHK